MKYEKDIAAHVISNIALIESTKNVIGDVEATVFSQLNAVVKQCVEKSKLALSNDKAFEFYNGDKGLYFSTVDWEASYKDQIAWYMLDYCSEEEEDLYPLSHVLGEYSKNSCLLFQFVIDKDEIGLGLRKFKSILHTVFFKTEALARLGFQLSECNTCIELRFHLDGKKVAEEYPDLEGSFLPLIKVLDTVFEAHPHFEALVEEVKLLAQNEVVKIEAVEVAEV
jgi:hypothetical protein